MTIWAKVTHDEFEHIIAMADSQELLAIKLGINKNVIASSMSHHRRLGKWTPYRKIEIEEGDDD
jgi:hypothetical protein